MTVWSMTITTTILYNHYSIPATSLPSFSPPLLPPMIRISLRNAVRIQQSNMCKKNFFFNCLDTKTGRNGAGHNDSTNETIIKQNRIPQKLVSTYWPQDGGRFDSWKTMSLIVSSL